MDSIVLDSSISSDAGATATSKFKCLDFISLTSSLKYGHFLWESCGEQNGKSRTNLGHIVGSRDSDDSSTESKRYLVYGIKLKGPNAKAKLTIYSDKGGVKTKEISLN